MHVAYTVRDYAEVGGPVVTSAIPTQRFFGIHAATNHKSETQASGWKEVVEEMYEVYNASPSGRRKPMDVRQFVASIVGLLTDHAEDQKKLARLICLWKMNALREIRGERAIRTRTIIELLPILHEENEKKISDAGGIEAWEKLSEEEMDSRDVETYKHVCRRLADEEFAQMSDEEYQDVTFFVWAGCCMHKELNSVKGGNTKLMASWAEAGIPGPVLLMNRDNAAAAAGEASTAKTRAVNLAQGGAVKASSLAGAIFHHKDDKKGQQDSFRIHFEAELGYAICFPGTSNIRFQSHCDASAELLVHLPLYITFLGIVCDKKESRTLNHMEANLLKALNDIPTLTEFAVLTLYSQSISNPYMRCVRGHDPEFQNVMDLGDLHHRLISHCQRIIADPDILLASDASFERGALDGLPWERPEAVYAVYRHAPSFPHLRNGLIAFFTGALETWQRFAKEYVAGGTIASATDAQRSRAFMAPTNDLNEGALGSYRVTCRRAPNLTLDQYNARAMYKKNGTKYYIRTLDSLDKQYLRKAARLQDSSGREKKRRCEEADADKSAVAKKRCNDVIRKATKDAKTAKIDAVILRLDVDDIMASPGTNPQIELQLEALRRSDSKIPLKSHLKNKAERLAALIAAVKRYVICHADTEEGTGDVGEDSDVEEGPAVEWDQEDEEAEYSDMEHH